MQQILLVYKTISSLVLHFLLTFRITLSELTFSTGGSSRKCLGFYLDI